MTYVVAINEIEASHLAEVAAAMQTLGVPVIRCFRTNDMLVALEGSHRLAAAQLLGIIPEFIEMDAEEFLTVEEIGWDDMGWFDGEPAHVCDIAERMMSVPGPVYSF